VVDEEDDNDDEGKNEGSTKVCRSTPRRISSREPGGNRRPLPAPAAPPGEPAPADVNLPLPTEAARKNGNGTKNFEIKIKYSELIEIKSHQEKIRMRSAVGCVCADIRVGALRRLALNDRNSFL
jgi:hypothetical protein